MLYALLVTPREWFDSRVARLSGGRGLLVAAPMALGLTLSLAVVLRLFTAQLSGTVEVDNPARPPDTFCDGGDTTPFGCTEPATVERTVGDLVWEAAAEVLPFVAVAVLVLWILFGVGLYLGALFAGGDGRAGATLEVAAWGLLPTLVSAVVGGGLLVAFAAGTDFSGGPRSATAALGSLQGGATGLALEGVQLAGAAWQAYVWTGGLVAVHDLSVRPAAVVAVVVAAVPVLLG